MGTVVLHDPQEDDGTRYVDSRMHWEASSSKGKDTMAVALQSCIVLCDVGRYLLSCFGSNAKLQQASQR
jgi:hypothetical protein